MEEYMLKNCSEEYRNGDVMVRNKDKWTLADLFIRQYLNNQCDGFGLYNVKVREAHCKSDGKSRRPQQFRLYAVEKI